MEMTGCWFGRRYLILFSSSKKFAKSCDSYNLVRNCLASDECNLTNLVWSMMSRTVGFVNIFY